MEDISDVDHSHIRRVCKDFEIKKLKEYHELSEEIDSNNLTYDYASKSASKIFAVLKVH